MPSERLQTAFFTQSPPFSIIPDNTVILKPVIPAQAGIQSVRCRNLSDKTVSLDFTFQIPTFVGMTAERLLLLPINAAISNPVIPAQAGI
ncbi:Uncharacterised protein [Neisseria meningitidis]|nr:Uncharacterised protein [Neisseria meningitidis]